MDLEVISDIWCRPITYLGHMTMSPKLLASQTKLNSRFSYFRHGKVCICVTSRTTVLCWSCLTLLEFPGNLQVKFHALTSSKIAELKYTSNSNRPYVYFINDDTTTNSDAVDLLLLWSLDRTKSLDCDGRNKLMRPYIIRSLLNNNQCSTAISVASSLWVPN